LLNNRMRSVRLKKLVLKLTEDFSAMAREMSKHGLRFTVRFPGRINESTVVTVDGNTAMWGTQP